MTLTMDVTLADRDVQVALELADGETLAVLGPNGSGKSSLLSAVAGILRPASGRITLDGTTLLDVDGGVFVPPHARGTALLAQEALLFPHLSALDNVGFGPRSAGATRAESRQVARRWLDEVEVAELADRRPSQLSGGQAQRVGLARALAADPRLLLLDEPMAALDVTVVPALRHVIRNVLFDRSAIIVTHDVLDALLLADRVLVLEGGRVAEHGPTRDVLARPRSAFGAHVAGLNLARGTVRAGSVHTPGGLVVTGLPEGRPVPDGAAAVAVFSPSAVSVHVERPTGSPRNVFATTVRELEPLGSQVRVQTDELSADVTAPVVAELGLMPGVEIFLAVKASEVSIYPA